MDEFETGAKNHATNEFILIAVNEHGIWEELIVEGGSILSVWSFYKNHEFKNINPKELDLGYLESYFKEAHKEYNKENGGK